MQGGSTGTGAGGQEDYLDKGLRPLFSLPSPLPSFPFTFLPFPSLSSSPPPTFTASHPNNPTHPINPRTKRSSQTGLDAAEKRFGGGNVNPEQKRGMNEKVTDGARGMFEKATGFVSYFFFPFLPPLSFIAFRCLSLIYEVWWG